VARIARDELASLRRERDFGPSIEKVRNLSMLPHASLVALCETVDAALRQRLPGALVECGVWRGGASFLMADLLLKRGIRDRTVWLFDSFEGHRAPAEIDGPAALAYATNTDDPEYRDNCRVSVESVRRSAADLGLQSVTEIVPGWFEDSLPASRQQIGPIAILRVDCDWYASVRSCLDNLYEQVVTGGFVILDDYYSYDGCAIAVHEFLAGRRLPHRIEQTAGVAFFRKA
jgi:O-methyltransferase